MKRQMLFRSLKIALAAVVSILLATKLGLLYAVSAGIVAILSLRGTKRETLKTAANRGLAFLCALVIAFLCFGVFGFTITAFGIFLFFFALLCFRFGWEEALAPDAVLISHFLIQKNMGVRLLTEELLVFGIGAGMAILLNLHLHRKSERFEGLADVVDDVIKELLGTISERLINQQTAAFEETFERLESSLDAARDCAVMNDNNALRNRDTYELDYVNMRRQQKVVLKEICTHISQLHYFPVQAMRVGEIVKTIQLDYHKTNTVEGLLAQLEGVLAEMKQEKLPVTREEFEARAILFTVLLQLKSLLQIKKEFICGR
ncbi:MAG: hypothetical protein E7287_03695 [Lachnospiraceae bacterium]|nr:hypothetical protein [Lachnospiraceae bacterium]